MKRYNQSIVSGSIAETLMEQTGLVARREGAFGVPVSFTLRHCSFKGSKTGGAVVRGNLDHKYEHTCRQIEETIKLKRGWTRSTLSRAIHRINFSIMSAEPLRRKREEVYRVWEALRIEKGIDVIPYADAGEAIGHTSDYETMSEADCAYWLAVSEKL